MTGQNKRHSVVEALVNTFTGMIVGFTVSQLAHFYQAEIQHYIWSGFVWNLSVKSNMLMTCILTMCSIIRGYIWRRIFNRAQLRRYKNEQDIS